MPVSKNRLILSILAGSVLAVILISASLPNLKLAPGHQQVAFTKGKEPGPGGPSAPPGPHVILVVKIICLTLGVLTSLAVIASLWFHEGRMRLLTYLSLILILFLVLQYAPWKRTGNRITGLKTPGAVAHTLPSSPAEEYMPQPPRWMVYAASLGVSALIPGLFVFLWLRWRRNRTGSLELVARAALEGRDYALPDDVKEFAGPALTHRLILVPDLWMKSDAAGDVIKDVLASVSVPVIDGA